MRTQRRTTFCADVYTFSMPVCQCATPAPERAALSFSLAQRARMVSAHTFVYTACQSCAYAISQRALMLACDQRLTSNERLKRATPDNPIT